MLFSFMRTYIVMTVGVMAITSFGASNSFAESTTEFSGSASLDLRIFSRTDIHDGQDRQTLNPSFVLEPEVYHEWNEGDDSITFIPFARIDAQDEERTHFDLREFNYFHIDDDWDLSVGFDKVFWGVTESRHLVDIINQTDAVEDIDGEDKVGQPMINLGLQRDWGDINLFVMPYFRERTYPGEDGRLRSPLVVDTNQAEYESDLEEFHPDLALRYSTVVGDWDIGLAHFYGTGREPRLTLGLNGAGDPVLVPKYDIINQSSFDIQATIEEWLWKVEAIYRMGQGRDFVAISGGLEYTFFGLVGEAGDLGIVAEYHFDDRDSSAPATLYDNDFFLGGRITLNDVDDTDFLFGILIDQHTLARSFTLEADRRLTDHWTIEGELRITNGLTDKDPIYSIRRDDHLQIRATYHF